MAISAAEVKALREKTGAGMMDCKKALEEANGDLAKAEELLRKKGILKAAKKGGRATKEGLIYAYIHTGGKLGAMVEVNCETDFVANTEQFQKLCEDLAMHIAAAAPLVVRREDVPAELIEKEKEIYRTQALNSGKPEKIVERIVEGRLEKYFKEVVLLEQPFIKNDDQTIQDLINETIAKLGENISVARFQRFVVGETGAKE